MNGFGKRLVSMLLALVMVLSMMPVTAFTARGEENTATEPAAAATEPVETQEAENSWQKYNLVDHLQSLPDNFCCSTNLWACLTPEEVMINHLGEWVKAGKTVYSITIQINPGDRIYANSFVEKGIQVSFIGEYGIVKTLFSADTKKAFQANGGYLIAPEGSIAVNIPVWDVNDENNTVNILNYDHVQGVVKVEATCTEDGYIKTGCLYCEQGEISDVVKAAGHSEVIQPGVTATCAEDGLTEGRYCDVCDQILVPQEVIPAGHKILEREAIIPSVDATGLTAGLQCSTCGTALVEQEKLPAVVQLKDYLRGMYVSVLGDSISTYLGVSNDTDRNTHTAGNVAGYRDGGYYANDDVTSADLTWWMQSINAFDMKLLVNHASGSGRLLTTPSNGTLPAYYDEKCLNLHDDSGNNAGMEPDIIAVYIGVNDGSGQKPAGSLAEIDFSKLIQGTSETGYQYATPITMAEGYAVMLHKMQNRYPEAEIFLFTIPRLNAPVPEYRPVIKEIAACFGVRVVDLYDSVLTQSGYSKYFFDGVHPNAEGMKVIASLFQEELLHLAAEYHAADGHTYENGICTVCGEETPSEPMSLRYDDHVDMTEKTVEIIDAGKPTSYQVGYGVEENKVFDTAVVTLEDNILVATGVGTAKVKIDGQLYEITVSAAPISLLLLIGQSNMQGIDGNPSESIVCPDGQVYATYADRYKKTVEDVTKFAPGALTGPYSNINVTGDTACLENYPVHMLTGTGNGREGMDSGLAYEWVKQTGEKVWVVNVGYGGSSITQWQKGGVHYEACLELFSACQETLRKEIAAGHFTMSNMAYFWCQGCADETQTAKWYADQFLTMHETLKTNMAFSEDVTFEFAGIIPIRSGHSWMGSYRAGVYKDTTNVPYYQSFMDLRFNGPRVAQYWMGNNPDLTDIWNVCTIQEGWATLPDGSDGVAEYFRSAYENGIVDYTTQVTQSASWYKPTTPAAVHDNIHYNQIGYNEIGREAARNALILLGEMEAPEVEAAVKFLTWDGFTPAEQITASTTGTSGTLVVPMVSPVWKSKEITYITTADLCYEYYDLLAETMRSEGKLTAVGATGAVTVAPRALTSYCWTFDGNKLVNDTSNDCTENTLVLLAGSVSGGTFSGIRYQASQSLQLLHNEAWCVEIQIADWKATSGSMLLSSSQNAKDGQPYFYFRPTDFFVGIGCYNGTTYDNYGISLKKRNIACSEGTHTYRFVNRIADDGTNMVYLFVDGQQIGTLTDHYVNSTLSDSGNTWISGKDFAMPYLGTTTAPISNCTINYLAVTETGYDPDAHFHRFSEWETVREPSAEGPGEEKRTCACGETDTREVEGVWQTLKLSEHMTAMPDEYCCATNLWTAMEHDKYYFATNSSWSIHHTGTVYSVTIPINAGDQIFATSFGAAGDNGGAKNGIITTFFNADGVEKILMPADTYAEFVNNGGYLVAPENTVAANLVMWTNSDKNELYLLNRDHTYENGVCSICGAEHPSLANYEGKVVSILGDSISTFAGYIPVADGFNLEHLARYPQDNLLTDVHETWWMQVIHAVDAKLGINDSWRGATVSGAAPVTTGTTGENAAMHNLTRIQNLGSNGTPDVILFYGGTNDLAHVSKVGGFDPASAPCEADLSTKKWDNLADGYVHTLLRLKHFYPEAQIVALLPTYTASYYSNAKLAQANAVLAEICDHYDVAWVDLRDCGITTAELPDGIHPDAKGMDYITDAVLTALAEQCSVKPGESKVYSVTHELRGVTASLGHYKGISAGKIFAEKLTGENMAVTVTMGGADITEACYDAGQICIENVTGDIVVIAEAKFSLGDRLQQLPENLCCGVNLWPVLRHDTDYYSVNGWVAHSSGKVRSVTIPVAAGEKIYASSFGAASKNGSTTNGIRVTFFSEDGMLITMGAPEVYAEFTVNGYLTAPESAVAVSIPMWTDDSGWELYLLSRKHNYENGICACGDTFAGKTVSILSHSASTYAGVSNNPAVNSTIGNNDVYYTEGRHGVYRKDTWWQQTIDALGMKLLVNNSWSGSCVFMPRRGEASVGYGDRAVNLHDDHTGEEPDIILVYLGCNDFAYYKDNFGKAADVDYAALIQRKINGTFTYAEPQTTCEAYAIMLHKVENRYPDALIYCMTSTARRDPDYADNYADTGQPTEYSAELHKVAEHFGFPVIDLENCIPKEAEYFDKYMGDKRAHPNALGMDKITNEVLSVMLEADAEIRHVTSENGVVAEQAVLLGGSYSADVELNEGYSVVVTMGGKDITEEAYQDGKITIGKVTGDIEIHKVIHRDPMNFRWELEDGELVSAGKSENPVSKLSGTVTEGQLNDSRYQLTTSVVLKHDRPWEVEWKCAGNWRGVVLSSDPAQKTAGMTYLSRVNGGQLCFGTWTGQQYNNYGVDVSYLDDQTHTYRLVNRIASDGSNMVWLYVDGAEIGAMNGYYIGSNNQNTTSDWINGKDFVFSYIGMEGHALRNCRLEYLTVTECAHTYENGICTGCGDLQETITHKQWTMSLDSVTFLNYYVNLTGFADGVDFAKQGGVVIWNGDVAPSKADQMQVGFENCRVIEGMFYNEEYGWCVKSHEIYAKNLGDMVYMRPFVEVAEGVYVYGEARYYSPELYCRDMLANERNRYDTRRVCAALLEYGAAAQQYFDYKVDDLVNEGLTLQKKYNLAYDSSYLDNIKLTDHVRTLAGTLSGKRENVEYGRSTLSLQGAIRISAGFNIDGTVIDWEKVKKAEVLFWTEERIAEVDSLAYELHNYTYSHELRPKTMADKVELGDYRTLSDHIQAKNLGEVLFYSCRIEMEDDSVFCSGLVYYSPEAFLNDHLKNSTGEIVTLCERIAVYGEMARLRFS